MNTPYPSTEIHTPKTNKKIGFIFPYFNEETGEKGFLYEKQRFDPLKGFQCSSMF